MTLVYVHFGGKSFYLSIFSLVWLTKASAKWLKINASTREFVSDYVVQFGKLLASSFMAGIWRDQFSLFTNKQNTVIKLLITNASSMLWATRCSRGLPTGLQLVSLCCVSEARHLTLTMPLSAQEYKLKPKNSRWTGVQQEQQQSQSLHASDNGITNTRIGFTSQLDFKPLFKVTFGYIPGLQYLGRKVSACFHHQHSCLDCANRTWPRSELLSETWLHSVRISLCCKRKHTEHGC